MTQLVATDVTQVYVEFTAIRGTTFRRKVELFTDEAKTKRRNLTGLKISVALDKYLTLVSGNGLVINVVEGMVTIELTPAQTKAAPKETISFFMEIQKEEAPEEVVDPLEGIFTFPEP
jgi:RNase P/RNase MRP subunit p29